MPYIFVNRYAVLNLPPVILDYNSTVLSMNPTGHWLLDEATGTTLIDQTGNYPGSYSVDITPYSETGAITGSTAKYFNSARDAYTTSTSLMGSGDVFTIMAFVKQGIGGGVIASCVATVGTRFIAMRSSNGQLGVETWDSINQVLKLSNMPIGTINSTAWTHVAITMDNGTIKFFANGIQYGTASYDYSPGGSFNQPFRIGTRNQTGGGYPAQTWDGSIDNVALWVGTALSNSQIATIYASITQNYASLITSDTPVAYWRLDDISGTTAVEQIGANNGTYSGSYTLNSPALVNSGTSVIFGSSPTYGVLQVPDMLNTSSNFSIEFWAEINSTYASSSEVLLEQGTTNQFVLIWDNVVNRLRMLSGGVTMLTSPNNSAVPDIRHHIVITYDPNGSGTMLLYIDGVLSTSNLAAAAPPNVATPMYFGARASGGFDFPLFGKLDEIALYNYVLPPSIISNHYAAA